MRYRAAKSPCCVLPVALLLSACASTPVFDTGGVDRTLTPRNIATSPQPATGQHVQWGGIILSTTNLEDSTQIEVLAYPLDTAARPQYDSNPLGRFILERAGYLEAASYAEGRRITVVGTVTGTRIGQVGAADYNYPVISARQLYLWPADPGRDGVSVFGYIGFGAGSGDSDSEIGFGF
jgi:outer membrane lipoprotein